MSSGKIEFRTYLALTFAGIIMLIAATLIFMALAKSKQDAEIVNALGRQRMLTQAMAKSVLAYAAAKNETNEALSKTNLHEYEQAKTIFAETLHAVQSGGKYPLDLALKRYGQLDRIESDAIQNKITEIERLFNQFQHSIEQFIATQAGTDKYRHALVDIPRQSNQLRKLSNDLVLLYTNIANENNSRILYSTIIMVVLILAVLIATAIYLKIAVFKRIQKTYQSIRSIAEGEGELSRRINDPSDDELGHLSRAFDAFIDKLHNMVLNIRNEIDLLMASAKDTELISNKTAAAINQQKTETQQVATAMQEMTESVNEVASNAANTEQETQAVDRAMHEGMEIVKQTIQGIQELANEVDNATETLNQLEAQSDTIGNVLDVIRGIAEQTNLLALNAAIEAARAGEQGRGFAVVADEVRTLASRTQESTQEIQDMIERLQTGTKQAVKVMNNSKDKVAQSVEQSNKTGETLSSISSTVAVISQMNAQIASATEEQSATTTEIARSIDTIMSATNQSADSAKLADAASEKLKQITDDLALLVKQFKL